MEKKILNSRYKFGGKANGVLNPIPNFSTKAILQEVDSKGEALEIPYGDVSKNGELDITDVDILADAVLFGQNYRIKKRMVYDLYTGEKRNTRIRIEDVVNYLNYINN